MRTTRLVYLGMVAVGVAALLSAYPVELSSQQNASVRIDRDDIGGVVRSAKGPEAGVWVIAETTDLPTKFAKIVVTDDQGRYVIPDLPKANYNIWVRGYGLVDSPKVKASPGKTLNLKAVVASSEAAAAEYYPAIYWYSMLKIPDKSALPGHGRKGQRHAGKTETSGAVVGRSQNQRLQYLSPAWQQGDAYDSQGTGRFQKSSRRLAAAHRFRTSDDVDAQRHEQNRTQAGR